MGQEGQAYSADRCRPLLTLAASLLLTCGPGKDWTGETLGGEETRCSGFGKPLCEVVTSSRNHTYWLRSPPPSGSGASVSVHISHNGTEWQVRVNSSDWVFWLSRKIIGLQRESGAVILSAVSVHVVWGASGLLDLQYYIEVSGKLSIPFSYTQNIFQHRASLRYVAVGREMLDVKYLSGRIFTYI